MESVEYLRKQRSLNTQCRLARLGYAKRARAGAYWGCWLPGLVASALVGMRAIQDDLMHDRQAGRDFKAMQASEGRAR